MGNNLAFVNNDYYDTLGSFQYLLEFHLDQSR